MPTVPIYVTTPFKNWIKTGLVERYIGASVMQQLAELTALKLTHLLGRPILAFHQHFVDALL